MTARLVLCLACLSFVSSAKNVETPPNIQEPKADMIKYVKDKVVQYCNATGNPKPTYSWKRDGHIIQNSLYMSFDPVTGVLTIPDFTVRENGIYTCIAMNTMKGKEVKAMSPDVKLILQEIGNWGDKTPDAPIRKHPGDYAKLTCKNAPESAPPGVFKWYLGDKGAEVSLDQRLFIDAEGSLHFSYVTLDDDHADKPYKCGVYNQLLETIFLGGPTTLQVTAVPPIDVIPHSKPAMVYRTTNAVGEIRRTIELECVFSGNPVPVGSNGIKWLDNSKKEIAENDHFKWVNPNRRRILRIVDLKESDEGIYTCTGRNNLGTDKGEIFLNVTSRPIWVKNMLSTTRPEGKNVRFPCITRPAKGEREVDTPEWFVNGDPRTIKNDSVFEFTDRNRVLTLKNINKTRDIMCIQCVVRNDIGRSFADACLNIVLPITVSQRPPDIQEITKGDLVLLTVKARTDESVNLQYQWFFKDKKYDINPPEFVVYDPVTLEAYINTTVLTEEEYKTINGTYIREVFYSLDRVNITTMVVLKELPAGVAVVAAQTDLWWIALIIALIILIAVIAIICVVCYRKKQEGVYPLDKKERAADLDPEKDLADSGFHDLSRADPDDDYPSKPKINPDSLDDDQFSDNEDDASLMEYGGDIDPGKFNEDGSFIGQYAPRKPPPPVSYQPNEVGVNIGHSEV